MVVNSNDFEREDSLRDIDPALWNSIYSLFRRNGFDEEEALWAADNKLDPKGKHGQQIQKILRNRRLKVMTLMKYSGPPKPSLEELALFFANQRREEAKDQGALELNNIFVGET